MHGRVKALAAAGWDGVKLDSCGDFNNLTWWAELIDAAGKPVLTENCHQGSITPGPNPLAACTGTTTPSDCPYNFFRTSGDISSYWGSMWRNLQTTVPYLGNIPLSRPGTWAYPDMLEVGNLANFSEDRSHFGAWVVVSAPLVLGYDLTNMTTTKRVWPIISNTEAIAISQTWAGHPGRLVAGYSDATSVHPSTRFDMCTNASFPRSLNGMECDGLSQVHGVSTWDACQQSCCADPTCEVWQWGTNAGAGAAMECWTGTSHQCSKNPNWPAGRARSPGGASVQLWAKPLTHGAYAAFVINGDAVSRSVAVPFAAVYNNTAPSGALKVRDVWAHQDLGPHTAVLMTDSIGPHDSRLYRLEPASA